MVYDGIPRGKLYTIESTAANNLGLDVGLAGKGGPAEARQ